MPSIHDVAKSCGVSAATVSRVLNNSGPVRPSTRQRVIAAIEQCGYVPNSTARNLRSSQTGLVGLIVPEINNPYYAIIAHGVQDEAKKRGLAMILCITGGNESDEIDYMKMLPQKRVDGFVVTPPGPNLNEKSDRYLEKLAKEGRPIVCIGWRGERAHTGLDIVTVDVAKGAREAMMHLTENGHTRIAFFGGPLSKSVGHTRLRCYRESLASRGIIVDDNLVFECDMTFEGGFMLAKQILAMKDRPTAIFAVNDMMAIGALTCIQQEGLTVPDEMAIVGFDDVPIASIIRPRLTTVVQPKYDLGRIATEHLAMWIEGSRREREIVRLPTRLVVRETTLRVDRESSRRGASL